MIEIKETFKNLLKDSFDKPTIEVSDKRIAWIDLAKGVCICLVILHHLSWEPAGSPIMLQIRMPLYFILSGLFFKNYGGGLQFAIKKANKILIPFIFFYFTSQLLLWLFESIRNFDFSGLPQFGIILENRLWFNNAIWFLLCLYEVNLICMVITNMVNRKWKYLLASLFIGSIGVLLSHYEIELPLYLDTALTATPLFCIGNLLKSSLILRYNKHLIYQAFLGIALLIVLACLSHWNMANYISFISNSVYGNYYLAIVSSVIAVSSILLLCKWIVWLPIVSYMGRYSIVVLCFHQIYIYIIGSAFYKYPMLYNVPVMFVVIALTCWICIPFAIKYIPWATAQKDLINNSFNISWFPANYR